MAIETASTIDWSARAAELKLELDSRNGGKGWAGIDEYQQAKDSYWHALAQSKGTTAGRLNPVGFWHAVGSN